MAPENNILGAGELRTRESLGGMHFFPGLGFIRRGAGEQEICGFFNHEGKVEFLIEIW
jgi:hypothetical protein